MYNKKMHPLGNQISAERGLWSHFTEGDLDAWKQIFQLFYKDLYGYGLKLTGKPELTKDCIHGLFVDMWERRDHLSTVNSIKAYLLASLRRRLLKKITKRRKYFKDQANPQDHSTNIQFSPEIILIRDEIKAKKLEALYKALDQLPDRQKEVLYLKYFNGMSYSEIEEILSIKYQSIKNHIYRATSTLKEILGEDLSKIAISLLPYLVCFTFSSV